MSVRLGPGDEVYVYCCGAGYPGAKIRWSYCLPVADCADPKGGGKKTKVEQMKAKAEKMIAE